MRKNKANRKNIGVYSVYRIRGVNLDNLVNIVKNRGIILYNIKKPDRKTLIVSVNYADSEKFFAITRELCYNIKRVGEKGALRFTLKLARNAGLVIGAAAFFLFSVFADDVILSVDYYGSGSVYEREINGYLDKLNVVPFARFSSFDLPALSDGIAAAHDRISFAECAKEGNRLKITLVARDTTEKTFAACEELFSPADGVIEFIKVYRGTALKNVGDTVEKGEPVCAGYETVKDAVIRTGVVAVVSVKGEYVYIMQSDKDGDGVIADIFARESFSGGEILSSEVEIVRTADGKYEYKVIIAYRRISYG